MSNKLRLCFFAQDWPRVQQLLNRWQRSYVRYGYGTWPRLFKSKKYYRHVEHRVRIRDHISWMMHREFGSRHWRYMPRVGLMIVDEERQDESIHG